MKHKHKEAFCHMLYAGASSDGKKQITVSIWNSRDGVTPFCFISKEFGIELIHIDSHKDRYDPNYKPKNGDLIWKTYSESDARDAALISLDKFQRIIDLTPTDKLEEPPYKFWCDALTGKENYIKDTITELVYKNQPKLEKIEIY